MLRGVRGRVSAALCVGAIAMATGAVGCGDDDDGSGGGEVKAAVASESAEGFIKRMTKSLETATTKRDCTELEQINARSASRFTCPAQKKLRESMARFEVVGVEEYGPGAVVDYKSGSVKDGAAIVMFVGPEREWGIGRFGILSEPSTDTSDEDSRDGYAKAVDEFLTSVRERDCDAYVAITFNGDDKKDVVCKQSFPNTKPLAKLLKNNPGVEPRYEGGNESYGFYSLEIPKPKPVSFTISIAKASAKGPRPFVVLDVTPGPTAAQRQAAQKALERNRKTNPNQPETSESRKVEGDPNTLTN